MTKWEYCQLNWLVRLATSKEEAEALSQLGYSVQELDDGYLIKGGALGFLNPFQEFAVTISSLEQVVNELGLDGWELVSHTVVPVPVPGMEVYFFKRPIEND